MTDNKEGPNLPRPSLNNESLRTIERDGPRFYKEVLHREATSLLARYLPGALPHQPTDLGFSGMPGYIGYFRGKHYVDTSGLAIGHILEAQSGREFREELVKSTGVSPEEQWQHDKEFLVEEMKKLGLPFDPEVDFPKPKLPEPMLPEAELDEPNEWNKIFNSLESRQTYTPHIWKDIIVLIHELIHQKQTELNPTMRPDLSLIPELANIDPDSMDRRDLGYLLRRSIPGKKDGSFDLVTNSIFTPVSEGTAVMGSFYVMQKFAEDLRKEGDEETASRVIEAKTKDFRSFFSMARNSELIRLEPTLPKYVEGFKIVSKLYKKVGIENISKVLAAIDLKACRSIAAGSPEYQQMTEDPSLLPGLSKAARTKF